MPLPIAAAAATSRGRSPLAARQRMRQNRAADDEDVCRDVSGREGRARAGGPRCGGAAPRPPPAAAPRTSCPT